MGSDSVSAPGALGIIAGGGELPGAIAQAAIEEGREVFLLGIAGVAEEAELAPFPHAYSGIGELAKIARLLREANCTDLTFAGRITRPKFSDVKLDARGAMALPGVVAAARRGDDALMRHMLGLFEKDGFRVIGTDEAAKRLLAPKGALGKVPPSDQDWSDISKAVSLIRAMGDYDVGQAVIVCDGLVLSVEAQEGTDAMLRRSAELPLTVRGSDTARRGVLVKAPKPEQERRVDLPVIGRATVELAAAAGLRGIAVQANSALILHRQALVANADRLGLFLIGFDGGEISK